MLRTELIPPDLIESERARQHRRYADRLFIQKIGAVSMVCASLLCGAGLMLHMVIH